MPLYIMQYCELYMLKQTENCKLHLSSLELIRHPRVVCQESVQNPPGQNGRHFADDISKCIFIHGKFCILIQTSLKFVQRGPINNKPALV